MKFLFLLLFPLSVFCQVDTNRVLTPINGNGFRWKNVAFDSSARMPRDTFKLRMSDSGSIGWKNQRFWQWSGFRWDTLRSSFTSSTLVTAGDLSPVFTTAETGGNIAFTLSNVAAYKLLGRGSGTGVPSYIGPIDSNWVSGLHTQNYYDTRYLQAAGVTAPLTFTDGIQLTGNTVIALHNNAIWNANQFQTYAISAAQPLDGQTWVFQTSTNSWQLGTVSGGGGGGFNDIYLTSPLFAVNDSTAAVRYADVDSNGVIHNTDFIYWNAKLDSLHARNDSLFSYSDAGEHFVSELAVGGGSSMRFGFSGEDDVAGEVRAFDIDQYSLTLSSAFTDATDIVHIVLSGTSSLSNSHTLVVENNQSNSGGDNIAIQASASGGLGNIGVFATGDLFAVVGVGIGGGAGLYGTSDGAGLYAQSTASIAGKFESVLSSNNTVETVVEIFRNVSSGGGSVGANGIGGRINFVNKAASTGAPITNQISSEMSDATFATATSILKIAGEDNGILSTGFIMFGTGALQLPFYGAGAATFDASGNITSVSDVRLKNVEGWYVSGLEELDKINPIVYKWNEKSGMEMQHSYIGFSAQNIRDALGEDAIGINREGYLSIQDRAIMATLVNSIKQLEKRIKQLEK